MATGMLLMPAVRSLDPRPRGMKTLLGHVLNTLEGHPGHCCNGIAGDFSTRVDPSPSGTASSSSRPGYVAYTSPR